MMFDDSYWQTVGIPDFSAGAASKQSLNVATDGTLYISFIDGSANNRVSNFFTQCPMDHGILEVIYISY